MPHIDLLELPYFTGISIDQVVSLIDAMVPCNFLQETIIMAQDGLEAPPLYIVTKGQIGISKRTKTLEEQCIAELSAPTVLGEVELFCHVPAVATARAQSRVQAFALSRAMFDELLAQNHPAIARFVLNIAQVACLRLAQTDALLCTLIHQENKSAPLKPSCRLHER